VDQLVQNTVDGSRPGYSGDPLKEYKMTSGGRRLGVTVEGGERVGSKIMKYIYKDKATGKEIEVFKLKITDKPSQIDGKMKAGTGGDYKTLLSGPDKTEFSTLKEAETARDNFYKENPLKKPKGNESENKKKARKTRKNRLDITDPTRAEGVTKNPFHHIRQIGGDVPLTTDDIAIIKQRMNSVMSQYNEPLNRIADAISKNNKLSLEAMNSKNENAALKYMKRVGELNDEAESLVKSAIKKLPNEYKNLIGFNRFSLPTDEYGLPIENEPLVVKKVGGAKVTKDAIPLTDLTLKQEKELRTQIKTDAKAGKDINQKQLKVLLGKFEARGCKGKAAGGRILFAEGTPGGKITECATKGIRAFMDDLKKGNYSKASLNILKGGGNLIKNIVNPMELLKLRNLIGPGALGLMAAFEAGVITDDVIRQGTPLNESLANNWLTKTFLPYTQEYAKAKNLLESGTVPSNMKKYVQDVVTFNDALMDIKGIENRKDSRLVDGSFGMIDGTSMYTKEQEQKDDTALIKKLGTLTEDVYTPGSAKALEMRSLQDENEATRMAKKEFSPIFGFDKLKDVRTPGYTGYDYIPDEQPVDLRPITYKDAEYEDKKLPLGLEQLYMKKLNLKPRDSLGNYFFKDGPKKKIVYGERKQDFAEKPISILEDLTDDYNKFERQKEASKYPGYYGANEKFMEGGIASLNVKK
jgi:hypothetical protein